MVMCNHCRTTRIPKNSLVRKENHLYACPAYHVAAAALKRQQSATAADTNKTHHDVFDSPSDDDNDTNTTSNDDNDNSNENNSNGAGALTSSGMAVSDVLPLDFLQSSIDNRALRAKPGNSKDAVAARYNPSGVTTAASTAASAARTNRTSSATSVADDIYSGMPYSSYSLPYSAPEPSSLRTLMAQEESRKRRRDTGSPPLPNESGSPARGEVVVVAAAAAGAAAGAPRSSGKRLKYAEFYLDEEDFDFVCQAVGAREERFRDIVERLARLVRLRDTRGP